MKGYFYLLDLKRTMRQAQGCTRSIFLEAPPLTVGLPIMTDEKKYQVPKKGAGDAAHSVAKAVLSAVPALGGSAAELFQILVVPPLEKRREAWMSEIADGVRDLEKDRGIRIDDLKENEQFISTLMAASQIAIRTHKQEKKAALRNAVLNAALPKSPEDAIQQMYLAFIDSFTEWHLRILRLFQAPPTIKGVIAGGLSIVVERVFPALKGRETFYSLVWRDLWAAGLVTSEWPRGTVAGNGLTAKRTSDFGDEFLRFVSVPE